MTATSFSQVSVQVPNAHNVFGHATVMFNFQLSSPTRLLARWAKERVATHCVSSGIRAGDRIEEENSIDEVISGDKIRFYELLNTNGR